MLQPSESPITPNPFGTPTLPVTLETPRLLRKRSKTRAIERHRSFDGRTAVRGRSSPCSMLGSRQESL